jgi:hypothetical protein
VGYDYSYWACGIGALGSGNAIICLLLVVIRHSICVRGGM